MKLARLLNVLLRMEMDGPGECTTGVEHTNKQALAQRNRPAHRQTLKHTYTEKPDLVEMAPD